MIFSLPPHSMNADLSVPRPFEVGPPHPLGWVPLAFAAWLVMFGVYEIVERTLLRGASADLLSVLHMVRGTMTSFALAGLVAWWMVSRGAPSLSVPAAGKMREMARQVEDREQKTQGLWVIQLRWLAIVGVLVTTFASWRMLGVLSGRGAFAVSMAAAAMAVYNAVFQGLLQRDAGHARLAFPQVFLDLVALTVMLGFAGGIQNPFSLFYLFHVCIAGVLFGRRQAYAVTAMACLLFCGMVLLQETGAWDVHPLAPGAGTSLPASSTSSAMEGLRWTGITGILVAFVLAAFSAAYFTTTLVGRLRERSELVLEASDLLSKEEAKTEEIVRSIGAAMVVLEGDNRMAWVNDKALEWFGTDLIGEVCHTRLWDDSRVCTGCSLGIACSERVCAPTERCLTVGGEQRVFLVQCSPIGGRGGQRLGLIQDITKIKRMQSQVAQEGKMAAVGRLAAGVAHELNNPLAAVASSAEILAGRTDAGDAMAPDELQHHLGRIEKNVYRCKRIIDNLLGFARRPGEQLEQVDLVLVLADVHDLVAAHARARSVLLEFPAPAALLRVALTGSHGHSIRQILINLLLNAMDATPAGGRVALELDRAANGVELTVSDTGHGIAPEVQARLFEPFHTTKPVGQGTGLGLYLSRQLVEALRGRIAFESVPGSTVFRIWLPEDSRAELERRRAAGGFASPAVAWEQDRP
ncbi:MAG: HAMP domain-containing histidine kinase [Candidatus Wallbacteria bacterium]|nr:HAMP domain-containing histidine kinase [Candidatus Wallbacteria bacterium]